PRATRRSTASRTSSTRRSRNERLGRRPSGRRPRRVRQGLLGPDEAHALVHLLERRGRDLAGLVGAAGEELAELALVGAELLVALLDRNQESDDRLADVLLELPVAAPVVAALELGDRLASCDGH